MKDGIDFMAAPAIDVHGHCGEYGGFNEEMARLMNASAAEVERRAAACKIRLTIVSELSAFDLSPEETVDVDVANARAQAAVSDLDEVLFYAVVNPKLEGWEEKTEQLLTHPKCAGVKLHPRWNYWSVEENGDRLFGFLSDRKVLTLTHTGNAGNEPGRFIPFANKYTGMKLILAHIGHDEVTDKRDLQIRAVQESTQGNVWADTSSFRSICSRLIEFACAEIGPERMLFGTDTPLYFTAMHKARVAYADIDDKAKQLILHDNAAALLEA